MDITRDEFERKIKSVDPNICFYETCDGGLLILSLSISNALSASAGILSFNELLYLSTHTIKFFDKLTMEVYTDKTLLGTVIKDITGLFQVSYNVSPCLSLTGTTVISQGYGFTTKFSTSQSVANNEIKITLKEPKCECGAHSVGSQLHSNWCELKEIS